MSKGASFEPARAPLRLKVPWTSGFMGGEVHAVRRAIIQMSRLREVDIEAEEINSARGNPVLLSADLF